MLERFNVMKKLSDNSLTFFQRSPKFKRSNGTKSFVRIKTEISLPTSSAKKERVSGRRTKNVKKNKKLVTESAQELNLFKEVDKEIPQKNLNNEPEKT